MDNMVDMEGSESWMGHGKCGEQGSEDRWKEQTQGDGKKKRM